MARHQSAAQLHRSRYPASERSEGEGPTSLRRSISLSASRLRAVLDEFFAAISAIDPARIAAAFTEDGEIEDPVGTAVVRGRSNIESSFANGFAVRIRQAEVETIAAFPTGNSIAAYWRMRATMSSGKTVDVTGIDVLHMREDGLIARVEGYWDPGVLS